MARRALWIIARIVFFVCGVISLLIAWLYAMLQGESLPYPREWVIFVAALGLVGGCSVLAAVLPRGLIAKVCAREKDDESLISTPLRLLGCFVAIFYAIAVGEMFAPHTWNLNPQLMLALCPLYVVRMTIDPSPVWIFLVFSPMSPAVYGSLGVTLGYARFVSRRRR